MSDFTPGQKVVMTEGDGSKSTGTFHKYQKIAGERAYCYIYPDFPRIANECRLCHLHWVKSA